MHFHDDTPLELSRLLQDDVNLLGLSEHAAKGGRIGRARQWVGGCVLAAFGAISCTYGEPLKAPGEGGPTWLRIESEHFTVVTDLDRGEAESATRELEDGLDAIAQIAFEQPRIAVEPATVVIFRDDHEFHRFQPPLVDAGFLPQTPNDLEGPRLVLAHGKLTRETRDIFFHELTHDLFHLNFGPAPAWLAEGWAQYYGSTRIEGNEILVGEALDHVTFHGGPDYVPFRNRDGVEFVAIPIAKVPCATDLVHMTYESLYGEGRARHPSAEGALRVLTNYAAVWALVHMLVDGPADYQNRFKTFVQLAKRGSALEAAFAQAFSDVTPRQFDNDFRLYLARREIGVWRAPYVRPTRPFAPKERYLVDAEVRLLRAQLTPWQGPRAAFAERDLDAAMKEAPGLARRHVLSRSLFAGRGRSEGRRASHPGRIDNVSGRAAVPARSAHAQARTERSRCE